MGRESLLASGTEKKKEREIFVITKQLASRARGKEGWNFGFHRVDV